MREQAASDALVSRGSRLCSDAGGSLDGFDRSMCHILLRTGAETVGIGRDGSGASAAEKPDRITLFGNGRDRLESPNLGSTPGHPMKSKFEPR
jgi:hypothetical protein